MRGQKALCPAPITLNVQVQECFMPKCAANILSFNIIFLYTAINRAYYMLLSCSSRKLQRREMWLLHTKRAILPGIGGSMVTGPWKSLDGQTDGTLGTSLVLQLQILTGDAPNRFLRGCFSFGLDSEIFHSEIYCLSIIYPLFIYLYVVTIHHKEHFVKLN